MAETSQESTPTKKTARKKTGGRVYAEQRQITIDLFELTPAQAKKNKALNPKEDEPAWVHITHQHFGRNYDSEGTPMKACEPVLGHSHEMTFSQDEDGTPVAKVGQAIQWTLKGGKVLLLPIPGDDHTHEATYIKSQDVKPRVMSVEFAKHQAALTAKLATPEGIKEGQ